MVRIPRWPPMVVILDLRQFSAKTAEILEYESSIGLKKFASDDFEKKIKLVEV
jgi:hypothetical protein